MLHYDGITFSEEATHCNGSLDLGIVQNSYCEIPMTTLTASPFLLPQGRLIQARVTAKNSLGRSTYSSVNTGGVLAQLVPHKPPSAPQRNASTTPSQLVVNYPNLTGAFTGGSQIVSLQLQWDAGTGGETWTTLIGESPYSTTTSYSYTSAIIDPGRVYKFRYRARNVFGWGQYSD